MVDLIIMGLHVATICQGSDGIVEGYILKFLNENEENRNPRIQESPGDFNQIINITYISYEYHKCKINIYLANLIFMRHQSMCPPTVIHTNPYRNSIKEAFLLGTLLLNSFSKISLSLFQLARTLPLRPLLLHPFLSFLCTKSFPILFLTLILK